MTKKVVYKIASIVTLIGLLVNSFKPSDIGNRYYISIGLIMGFGLGIYFANYFRKE